jgi:hypothetical protein
MESKSSIINCNNLAQGTISLRTITCSWINNLIADIIGINQTSVNKMGTRIQSSI